MAKIYGLFGTMTGKLADTVMSVRNGEQIARKYQPVVFNPSTPAQVAQRAKLKLLSQLSAVMAPVIAMPRIGAVSSRNLFTKKNFPATTYADNQADITLTSVKLTSSVVSLPGVYATRGSEGIAVTLLESPVDMDRVVFVMFEKRADNTLRLLGSEVVTVSSAVPSASFPANSGNLVVYAYGVRDNTEAARTLFGEMTVITAETVAKVVVTRVLTESDITLSETVSNTLSASPANQMSGNRAEENDEEVEKKKKK